MVLAFIVAAALSVSPIRADDSTTAPTLTIRIRSIDGVLDDVKYISALGGRDKEAKQLDEVIKKNFPKGLAGIDTKRPLGLYGKIDENLMDSWAVVMIPVADEKAVLGLLESVHFKATKEDDDVYVVNVDNAPPVYFRFANGYAYATVRDKGPIASNKLTPPAQFFAKPQMETFSASFRIDQIPDVYKQIVLGQAELRVTAATEEKQPGETEQQHAVRKAGAAKGAELVASIVKEGAEIRVRLNVDRKAERLLAEVALSGKPGSPLAANIAALGKTDSIFGGMVGGGSALSFVGHGALSESLRKPVSSAVIDSIKSGVAKETDKAKRAAGEKLLEAITPTLQMGELDFGANLVGPTAENHYAFVAGLKIKDGMKLQQTLRDLLKELPEPDRSKITLDAEAVGDVKIARIDKPDLDENARKSLGDHSAYVAFRDNAVFLAGGEGGLAAIKQAVEAKPKAAPLVQLEMSAARMAPLIAAEKKTKGKAVAIIAEAFGSGKDNDKIHVTLEGGDALTLRFAMGAPVLKFLHMMDKENKESK
jgi:hypothetical protein